MFEGKIHEEFRKYLNVCRAYETLEFPPAKCFFALEFGLAHFAKCKVYSNKNSALSQVAKAFIILQPKVQDYRLQQESRKNA